jgi:hypothetical protein
MLPISLLRLVNDNTACSDYYSFWSILWHDIHTNHALTHLYWGRKLSPHKPSFCDQLSNFLSKLILSDSLREIVSSCFGA